MKLIYPCALVVLLSSCLGYKELPVEYDYSYNGNFKRYRTFEIMRNVGLGDTGKINQQIEKAILARMKFLGYKQTSHKPHLMVGFRLYSDSLSFNGYSQPDIEEWVKSQRKDIDYDKQRYNLRTGTLLIQFYDRRQSRSIWQGYATTNYGNIDYNNIRHLRNAVASILDKYRFWAEGFIEGAPGEEKDLQQP